MRMLPDTQRKCRRKGIFAASSLLLLLATQTVAQSGRRTPKAPSPTPTPQSTGDAGQETSKIGARELSQNVNLFVASTFTSKHLISEDAIYSNLLKRLGESINVNVTSLGNLKRSDAIKRAKAEPDTPVVLVEFDVDEFQSGTIILNSPDLDVRILVFAPQTGQKKFEGKVYYKAVGGPMLKRDNWPNGTPIRITTEAVGIEAAEQVRDWLIVEDQKKKTPNL